MVRTSNGLCLYLNTAPLFRCSRHRNTRHLNVRYCLGCCLFRPVFGCCALQTLSYKVGPPPPTSTSTPMQREREREGGGGFARQDCPAPNPAKEEWALHRSSSLGGLILHCRASQTCLVRLPCPHTWGGGLTRFCKNCKARISLLPISPGSSMLY